MDIGGVNKAPAAASTYLAANRPEPTASGARAVETTLPRSETVRASAEARAQTNDRRMAEQAAQLSREQLMREFIRSRAVTDPRTREVVFQAVNMRTGEVLSQLPNEMTLRLREYVSSLLEPASRRPAAGETRVTKIA